MTSLFLEYEKQRERNEFNKSFIGKKFYWTSTNFKRINLFTIKSIITDYASNGTIVEYIYDYEGSFQNLDRLEYILSHATEYDPANFPAGHLD